MHLGELAAARAETTAEAITFDWHGSTIRCRTDLPAMPLLELAATGDELKGTAAEDDFMVVAGAFYRFLESVIDPGDWSTFRRVSTRHADGPEQLLPLIERIAEAIAGRPTGAALRLARWAAANYGYLDGTLALSGLDPAGVSARRLTNIAYAVLARGLDDDGIVRLNAQLLEPVMTDRARRRVSQHRRRVAVTRFGGEVIAS